MPTSPKQHYARIRELKRKLPFFTVQDLSTTTGFPTADVRAALAEDAAEQQRERRGYMPVYAMTFIED